MSEDHSSDCYPVGPGTHGQCSDPDCPQSTETGLRAMGYDIPKRNEGNECRHCVHLVSAWFGLARRCVGLPGRHLRAVDAPRCNLYEAVK